MALQHIKIQYKDDLRRFSLNDVAPYSELQTLIRKSFLDLPQNIQIFYKDEDDDKILINSESEYQEAKRVSRETAMRLYIEENHSTSEQSNEKGTLMETVLQSLSTDPSVLQTLVPSVLKELNKPQYLSEKEISSIGDLAVQLLSFPAVQGLAVKHLPQIVTHLNSSSSSSPPSFQFGDLAKALSNSLSTRTSSQPSTTSAQTDLISLYPSLPNQTNMNVPSQEVPSWWAKELGFLAELGFTDTPLLVRLLEESKGDVAIVINRLTE
eukprot:TRINITY_DN12260_c0_g1_i1.p1 TRINITY_DN12260_c0_g1~~TRINITY_DN12260_c0_g1_i1.p1  ORF type:complete len:267 (+),score=64.35 TRINITY_DN12260_c0_g1_i1:58-858(+)